MRRWRLGRCALVLLLAPVACAARWSGPIAYQPGAPWPCPPGPPEESCFEADLQADPLIVAPGRILVMTEEGLRNDRGMLHRGMPGYPFVVEEITLAGHADVAQGYCPKPAEPAALAQLATGDLVVACLDIRSIVDLGVVDRVRRTVDWRWRVSVPGILYKWDVRVVEVGPRIGVVYPIFEDRPGWERPWALTFADGGAVSLDHGSEELLGLVSVGQNLQILFSGPSNSDEGPAQITVSPSGAQAVQIGAQLPRFQPGLPGDDCIARDLEGTVTVRFRTRRGVDDPKDGFVLREGAFVFRYPNGRVSGGADAWPAPDGGCLEVRARYGDDGEAIERDIFEGTDWWVAHPVRATRVGRRELVVYETPPPPDEHVAWNQGSTVHVERR